MIKTPAPRKRGYLVTLRAVCGELRHNVVWILRRLKIATMTPDARRGCPDVFVLRRIGVACLARHGQMSPHQRKSRLLMLVDHIRHLPRLRGVTLEAVRPQLTPVDISMAGNTVCTHL